MFSRKILIMGLPGAGKTSLARSAAPRLNAVHFNADDVRREINKDLGFSESDRVEHARRMGWLCDQVVKTGYFAVADFICPTPEARAAFAALPGSDFTTYGATAAKDSALISLGAQFGNRRGFSLNMHLDSAVTANSQTYTGIAGLNIAW